MTKVSKNEIFTTLDSEGSVGLSYSPYLTALEYDIQLNIYEWGESDIRMKEAYKVNILEQRSKPPKNEGTRVQKELSKRGKIRIKRAARCYQHWALKHNRKKGFATMITLTFGKNYPSDIIAKNLLDSWLKRLRRKIQATKEDFHYCWVAERQTRGAIHFHILTPHYVPKHFINDSWSDVVNSYYIKQNEAHKTQKLYPNVIAVYNAGAYMAKYCQKQDQDIVGNGYSMSQATSKSIKPISATLRKVSEEDAQKLFDKIQPVSKYTKENEFIRFQWMLPECENYVQTLFNTLENEHNQNKKDKALSVL